MGARHHDASASTPLDTQASPGKTHKVKGRIRTYTDAYVHTLCIS